MNQSKSGNKSSSVAKVGRARSLSARTKLYKRAHERKNESNDDESSNLFSDNRKAFKQKYNVDKSSTNQRHRKKESFDSNESTDTLTSRANGSISSQLLDEEAKAVVASSNPIKYSCSSSLIDLCVLIFRYRDACHSLIEMIIPVEWQRHNQKFFQAKFNCLNKMFQVIF